MFVVYILKSLKDGNLYIGRTNNLSRRLAEHNSGRVSSTRSRWPFKVLKFVQCDSEIESVQREGEFKKGFRREQLKRELGGVA